MGSSLFVVGMVVGGGSGWLIVRECVDRGWAEGGGTADFYVFSISN